MGMYTAYRGPHTASDPPSQSCADHPLNKSGSTCRVPADRFGFTQNAELTPLEAVPAAGFDSRRGHTSLVPELLSFAINVFRISSRFIHGPAFALAFVAQACGPHTGPVLDGPAQPSPVRPGAPADASAVTVTPSDDGGGDAPSEAEVAFQPEQPAVYVAKVKNVLVGLPPTEAEIQAVATDPTQLKSLIDGWMALPQYTEKMLTFFELAFQQTQIAAVDFADQVLPRQVDVNGTTTPLIVQNARESFARTVLSMASSGQPFNSAMTTQSFMLTPALMELYAFLDVWQVDDAGKVTDGFKVANPKVTLTVEAAQGPIPIAQTLDPQSANYMVWYDPDVANLASTGPGCAQDPVTYPAGGDTLHYILTGALLARKNPSGGACGQLGGTAAAPQLAPSDYTTWKMVTIRPPALGESTTKFYDLPTLRTATELVLVTPRIGFFSTPAFFANWQTNTSNQMRVTMNQSLIVATGAQVDGTDMTVPTTSPGLDEAHATLPACVFCHRTLDPTRSILAATYSWNYHQQDETLYSGQDGLFAFQGVIKPVTSVTDLGSTLATHPLMPSAWAQKLCYYVNSSPCETNDPEFQRIVALFQSSSLSWNVLVREIFSSPLTTYAMSTQTASDNGEVIAVSRRDHFCAALNARLGFSDVCGLDATTKMEAKTSIPEIVSGLPSDGYGRGAVAPVLPNASTLFYRAGTENICESVAALVIDVPTNQQTTGVKQWSSTEPTPAISDFVQILMGLTPSDPRSASATQILTSHFTSAVQSGASPSNALKSTFTAACLAPTSISIGL